MKTYTSNEVGAVVVIVVWSIALIHSIVTKNFHEFNGSIATICMSMLYINKEKENT